MDTGFTPFSVTVDKTNRLLRQIEEANGWSKEQRNHSYGALRATLHALRDRLTLQEASDFAAQLPLLVRGIYYDGWAPQHVPVKMNREEFLARVRAEAPYEVEGGTEKLVHTVLDALEAHVSEGEWRDVASVLPKDLKRLVPSMAAA